MVHIETIHKYLNDPLFINSYSLIINSIFSAFLGVFFWILMSNLYSESEIGVAISIISLAMFVAANSRLGLDEGLKRFILTKSGEIDYKLIKKSLFLASFTSIVFSILFFLFTSLFLNFYPHFERIELFFSTFMLLSLGILLNLILDSTFIGIRKSYLIILNTFSGNIIKIFICVIMTGLGSIALIIGFNFTYWCMVLFSTFLLISPIIRSKKKDEKTPDEINLKEVFHFSFYNYFAGIMLGLPSAFIPFIVIKQLGEEFGAYYYIVWMISNLLFFIPRNISTSFMVETSFNTTHNKEILAKTLVLMTILLIPAILFLEVYGYSILMLFGNNYALNGLIFLNIMTITVIPFSFNTLYLDMYRIRKYNKGIINLTSILGCGILLLSLILIEPYGLVGIGLSWLIVHLIISLLLIFHEIMKRFNENIIS